MITWIQIRFQKHFKWLFIALLIVMIFTFVLTIGNQSFFGTQDTRRARVQDFYGYNLSSEGTKSFLLQGATLSANVSPDYVQQMGYSFDLESYGNMRAVGLSLAKMLGVGEPDKDELAAYARTKPIFMDKEGEFSAKRYKDVMMAMALRQRVPEETMLRILSDDYRIARVRELLGGAGFIDPDAVALERQLSETKWSFSTAELSFDDFKPEMDPTADELKAFYDENPGRFEIPERLQLTQVRFPAMAYVAQVESPSDEEVQTYFERNKARFTPAAVTKEDGTSEQPEAVLTDAVKATIVQVLIQAKANQIAAGKADDYTVALWREEVKQDSPRVQELAKSMGAEIRPVEPFGRDDPPHHTDLTASQLNNQWDLVTSERYFSDVQQGRDCASVLLYNGVIAARQPPYEEVVVEVEDAYKATKRSEAFLAHAKELRSQLENALKAGTAFADAATELGLKVDSQTDITMATVNYQLGRQGGPLDVASHLKLGELSDVQLTQTGAFIAQLEKRDVPALDSVRPDTDQIELIRKSVSSTDGWTILDVLAKKRLEELKNDMGMSKKDGEDAQKEGVEE